MNTGPVDLRRIKAISFDLDDTLWAIRPVIERAERASQQWLMQHYPDTRHFFQTSDSLALRAQVFEEFPDKCYDLTFLRKECVGRILEQSGYDRSGVEPAFAVFFKARNEFDIYDDVLPFFATLNPQIICIALTNGNASLEQTPLKDQFHTYLNAIKVKAAKPAAPMFEEALSRHELNPDEMLHVGDCLIADIGGAMEAGIPTVWVNRFSREWADPHHRPHFVVNNFTQLTHLLNLPGA